MINIESIIEKKQDVIKCLEQLDKILDLIGDTRKYILTIPNTDYDRYEGYPDKHIWYGDIFKEVDREKVEIKKYKAKVGEKPWEPDKKALGEIFTFLRLELVEYYPGYFGKNPLIVTKAQALRNHDMVALHAHVTRMITEALCMLKEIVNDSVFFVLDVMPYENLGPDEKSRSENYKILISLIDEHIKQYNGSFFPITTSDISIGFIPNLYESINFLTTELQAETADFINYYNLESFGWCIGATFGSGRIVLGDCLSEQAVLEAKYLMELAEEVSKREWRSCQIKNIRSKLAGNLIFISESLYNEYLAICSESTNMLSKDQLDQFLRENGLATVILPEHRNFYWWDFLGNR